MQNSLSALTLCLFVAPAFATAQNPPAPPPPPPTPLRIAASSQASVEVHLNARRIGNQWYEEDASLSGPSRIAISYGQPHARGRRVERGPIPLDTVWRGSCHPCAPPHTAHRADAPA